MRSTIVYLHGFRSSPASAKARLLGAAVAGLPRERRPTLHVPALDHRPAVAMATILGLAEGLPLEHLTFVGSSLGGFYATRAAEHLGARAALVNPAVRPYDDLAAYRGPQTNLYTGEAFEVTDEHFAELRRLAVPRIARPSRYLLLVQTGDEVLDYREAVRFYAGAWQWVEGGGDHAFRDFAGHIPALLRFCGVGGPPGFTDEGRVLRRD
ncbi:MAG: YqiA/YcfP family alpha/beta fold hydrolase [Rudaea sp.]